MTRPHLPELPCGRRLRLLQIVLNLQQGRLERIAGAFVWQTDRTGFQSTFPGYSISKMSPA